MSYELLNMPPPQCPPPLTDCIFWPSTSTHELSYPYQRQVDEAPIGSITSSRSTCGSGRRHTCSAASAITLTRTSLYLKCVPGSHSLRCSCSSSVLPTGRSAQSGLPHSVPCQSLVCRSRSF